MKDREFNKSTGGPLINNAKGNRQQAARELTEDEVCLFFQTRQGKTTPKFSSARCGDCCLCISALERETSVVDYSSVG